MKKLLIIMVSVLLLLPVLGCIKPSEKVLLIFSYHPEYPWVVEETRGAEDILDHKCRVEGRGGRRSCEEN